MHAVKVNLKKDCTVGGSKESRGSTVTLYVYPAAACGGYVGASSSRVAFRAVDVEVSCSVAAGLAGCRAGVGVLLQMSIRDCCVLLVWVLRFGCWSLRFCFLCWLGCLLRLVLGVERWGKTPVPAFGEGIRIFTWSWWATPCGAEG